MIVGLIEYKSNTCVFKLDPKQFILQIEEIDERENSLLLTFEHLLSRSSFETNPDNNLLIGKDFENEQTFHFIVRNIRRSGGKAYRAHLDAFVKFSGYITSFDGLQIQADELDWFHNINQAYDRFTYLEDGGAQFQINPFDKTIKDFTFNFKGQKIEGKLTIASKIANNTTTPIKTYSSLNYHFDVTDSISFVEDLVYLSYQTLQFVTYRKNHKINNLYLKKMDEESGKYNMIGQLYVNNRMNIEAEESEKVIRERIIDYPLLDNQLPKLLERIDQQRIYLKHIPESSEVNNFITPARFVMATAGFEWQIRFSHSEKSEESEEKYRILRDEVIEFLEDMIIKYTGEDKKYFKSLKKLVNRTDSSLSSKIRWALNEYNDILDAFIINLYSLNKIEKSNYTNHAISLRIETQRNNIAHGNLDKELDELIILDFLVLEWLYYVLVLRDIGVPNEKIKLAINKLFNRNIAL